MDRQYSEHHTSPMNASLGSFAGLTVAILSIAYAMVLSIGLLTLPGPEEPIQNPWFTMMEILILLIAPAMVAFSVGLQYWTSTERKALSLLSVIFMSMCALITCCVHFAILTLSNHPSVSASPRSLLDFSFKWPSLVYAMDILAWDIFFPLAALFAAVSIRGGGMVRLARNLLYGSAALSFIGLAGIPTENMNIRNIGILGYVVLFPLATFILAIAFRREADRSRRPKLN